MSSSTSRSTPQTPGVFELPTRCGWSSTQFRFTERFRANKKRPLLRALAGAKGSGLPRKKEVDAAVVISHIEQVVEILSRGFLDTAVT